MVTEAPDGVLVAAWLFKTPTWSTGELTATPLISHTTAVPFVPAGLGLTVRTVAPAELFCAYQTSSTVFGVASMARAPLTSE